MCSVKILKTSLNHHKFLNPWALMSLSLKLTLSFLIALTACAPTRKQIYYPPQGGTTQQQSTGQVLEIPPLSPVTPEDEKFGHEILSQLSKKYPLDYNHPRRLEVDDVVKKITVSIGGSNQPWHVNVFSDNKVKNAAATRGNNIFIWTGMIDATNNDSELAAVLSHEIAHILARHTEPSSGDTTREFIVGLGAMIAGTAVGVLTNGAIGSDIASQLASSLTKEIGAGILIYPYSRDKEYEADEIGLFLMHKSGYDPKHAINFWKRAANDPDFSSSIPFFSTHPPAADRLDKLINLVAVIENNKGSVKTEKKDTQNTSPINQSPKKPNKPQKPQNTSNPNTLPNGDSFDIRNK